jgi:hypothetical protein
MSKAQARSIALAERRPKANLSRLLSCDARVLFLALLFATQAVLGMPMFKSKQSAQGHSDTSDFQYNQSGYYFPFYEVLLGEVNGLAANTPIQQEVKNGDSIVATSEGDASSNHSVHLATAALKAVPAAAQPHVSAGLHINLIPDANNVNAPAGWDAIVQQAAQIIEQNFSDPVTINLRYGYASFNNAVDGNLIGSAGAYANTDAGQFVTYSTCSWLLTDATTAEDGTANSHLPAA